MQIKFNQLGIKLAIVFLLCVLVAGSVRLAAAESTAPARRAADEIMEYAPGDIIVKFEPGQSMSMSADLMGAFKAEFVETVYGSDLQVWRVAEGKEAAIIEQLEADPGIAYAELNYRYSAFDTVPSDPYYDRQWAHTKMQSPKGWDLATGSSAVTIAVIDTGIDSGHPDLVAKIVAGWDFVDGDGVPNDTNGHGTHVAGISVAIANNGEGVAGVSWGARVMPIRVLGDTGSGWTTDIVAGINWARQNGADVINLSLGGINYNQAMQDAVTAAHNAGIPVIAAMGNCRTGCTIGGVHYVNPTQYPAAYNNVFAVAATDPADNYAPYSQYGSHCDISAPGGKMDYLGDSRGIYSTLPTYAVYLNTQYGYLQNYDYLKGTSQAAPQVSGLAALILSVDPMMTPSEVERLIENSSIDLGTTGWDSTYGHGRIDVYEALKAVRPPVVPILASISNPTGDNSYTVDWNDATGADTYTLQEADNALFNGAQNIYSETSSQTSVSGKASGTWYYRVRASNSVGDSGWSNTVSTTVKPDAPTLNSIDNSGNLDAYTISWHIVPGADGYQLQEAEDAAFSNPVTRYRGPSLQYAVTGQAGGTWYYRVLAYNAGGNSPWSDWRSTGVTPSSFGAPAINLISNPENDGDYTVNWSSVSGATAYILEESFSRYFEAPVEIYTGTLTQFEITDRSGGTWYYRVRASNATELGPWSDAQSTLVMSEIFLPLVMKNYAAPDTRWLELTRLDYDTTSASSWTVLDGSNEDGGEYYWGKRTCQPYAGNYSGWVVGGGADGSVLSCGSHYPNSANIWMIYGPFDLSAAQSAELIFQRWLETEWDGADKHDNFSWLASVDGTLFYGTQNYGNSGGWDEKVFDLTNVPTLGDITGQSQVWIAFKFDSDATLTEANGVFLDDILLRVCTTNCASLQTSVTAEVDENLMEVPISVKAPPK